MQEIVARALARDFLKGVSGFLKIEQGEFLRHLAFKCRRCSLDGRARFVEQDDVSRVSDRWPIA